MSEKPKQKVALELRRTKSKDGSKKWVLRYGRFRKDGEIGWAETDWKIGEISWLPRPFFTMLWSCVLQHLTKLDVRNFETMEGPIRVALAKVAALCGCGFTKNNYGGLTLTLDNEPLLAVAVVNYEKHKDRNYKGKGLLVLSEKLRDSKRSGRNFRRMERNTRARLRGAIVVLNGGLWRFAPGKTRPEDKL